MDPLYEFIALIKEYQGLEACWGTACFDKVEEVFKKFENLPRFYKNFFKNQFNLYEEYVIRMISIIIDRQYMDNFDDWIAYLETCNYPIAEGVINSLRYRPLNASQKSKLLVAALPYKRMGDNLDRLIDEIILMNEVEKLCNEDTMW